MKSEDDPEARIRELEQPLADTARVSEFGPTPSKWAPPSGPPVPPPLPYDGSFSTPRPGTQNTVRWIMLGVFVIGLMCLPLGIFLFSAHHVSRSLSPIPIPSVPSVSVSPTRNATSTAEPTASPTSAVTAVPAGETVTVSGISNNRTIACKGGKVSISGITNNVTITGHCASVNVSGIQNQITLDAADTIDAAGSGNHVTYHHGSPKVGKTGLDNIVEEG